VVLLQRAREGFSLRRVLFAVAKVTVDKEQARGMSLEDRLLLLRLFSERHEGTGVVLFNRGLYFEQAQALRRLFGGAARVSFVVGMDKVFQIFDPRYYGDRDRALDILFGYASLIVGSRGGMGEADLEALLARPENRRYRDHVHFLCLPGGVQDLSAREIRSRLAAGKSAGAGLPREAADFIAETRAYEAPQPLGGERVDAYDLRRRVFDLLWSSREWAERGADFARLMTVALSDSPAGAALRALAREAAAGEEAARRLAELQASA
jgi:nicotinic acid mononucleotide adenylyltransferase